MITPNNKCLQIGLFDDLPEEEIEEFDKSFTVMEKAWRPSQEIFYIQCRSSIG